MEDPAGRSLLQQVGAAPCERLPCSSYDPLWGASDAR